MLVSKFDRDECNVWRAAGSLCSSDHDDYVIDYGTLLETIRFSKKHIEKCTGRPDLDMPNLPENDILCLSQYPDLWNRYALEVVPHMKYIQAQHQLWQVRQGLLEARQEAQQQQGPPQQAQQQQPPPQQQQQQGPPPQT